MATLTGELISETYDSLLKVTDNNTITGIKKRITDGFGNDIPLLLSSTDIEIDGSLILSALTDLAPATKFLSLKADNTVGFRTSSELLSDIGGASSSSISGTTGRLSKFTSSGAVGNSILNEIGNVIHLTDGTSSYASFGINNPGVDNDAYIGSTINNDFLIKINNVEALRIDTALRLKIANIQNALGDTDKFLVSEDGVVKYRTGAEVLSDIGGASASGFVPNSRTLSINGTTQDLSADRTFSVGTVTSIATNSPITGGTITNSGTIGINQSTSTIDGYLSSTDWNTFNNKQGAIILTTSGSSGASTLIGNTLNIPNYSQDLSGFVTLNTVQTITAQKTFSSSGGSDTLIINHSSGSGIALNITKGGNGEGIYVNKTSGSGNAVTVIGTLNATTLVKNGGTSSQFLKADGSVDSNSYALASSLSDYLPLTGGTLTGVLNGTSASFSSTLTTSQLITNSLVSSNKSNNLIIATDSALGTSIVFSTDFSERMRLNNSGNLLIGTTTDAGYKLYVNGAIVNQTNIVGTGDPGILITSGHRIGFDESGVRSWNIKATGGNLTFNTGDGSGTFYFNSSVTASSFITISDKRLKNIIQKEGDLVTYTLKDSEQIHYGYIAQDMEAEFPNQVNKNQDGYLSLNYIEILVKKVHDLEQKIIQLENK